MIKCNKGIEVISNQAGCYVSKACVRHYPFKAMLVVLNELCVVFGYASPIYCVI